MLSILRQKLYTFEKLQTILKNIMIRNLIELKSLRKTAIYINSKMYTHKMLRMSLTSNYNKFGVNKYSPFTLSITLMLWDYILTSLCSEKKLRISYKITHFITF